MPAQQQLQQTKVTDGRAQMRLKDELGCTAVAKYVREVLPPSFFGAGLLMHDACPDTVLSATLGRNVQPAVYGFTAGTISEPAHELNEFGSLRMNMSGARAVAMVSTNDVAEHTNIKTVDAQVWLSSVTPDRLETLVKAGFSVWVCTQGPGDILYVTAGHVNSRRVMTGSDCVGLRLGCLAMASESVMQHLFASRAALNQPLNEALQEGLKLLEERVLPGEPPHPGHGGTGE